MNLHWDDFAGPICTAALVHVGRLYPNVRRDEVQVHFTLKDPVMLFYVKFRGQETEPFHFSSRAFDVLRRLLQADQDTVPVSHQEYQYVLESRDFGVRCCETLTFEEELVV